jgi:hypothetical protein
VNTRPIFPIIRDRATAVAVSIQLIIDTPPPDELRQALENFLRDELFDLKREIAGERDPDTDAF